MSTFFRSQILQLFLNTMAADVKYPRHKIENFTQQIGTKTFKKLKNLCQVFFEGFKSR